MLTVNCDRVLKFTLQQMREAGIEIANPDYGESLLQRRNRKPEHKVREPSSEIPPPPSQKTIKKARKNFERVVSAHSKGGPGGQQARQARQAYQKSRTDNAKE